jgi:Fe-S cluster biogenesis protein NfuA/nitrite reductase/ring-hydroxylating ferredoxin subunit
VPASNTSDVQAVGSKVEALLAELAASSDPATAGRAEEQAAAPLLNDGLVTALLVLHELHPQSTEERVLAALDRVRPYLGSHAGDVEYLGLDPDGTVRLRLAGSCDGCPSSTITVKMAIEKGIEDVAPEVTKVEVENMTPQSATGPSGVNAEGHTLLPLTQVSKSPEPPPATWVQVEGVEDLGQGQLAPALVGDIATVVCNVGGSLYAYADRCPACGSGLTGAELEGVLLSCPGCAQRYDVVRAGRGFGNGKQNTDQHLDPLPLLTENGGVRIAVPAQAAS